MNPSATAPTIDELSSPRSSMAGARARAAWLNYWRAMSTYHRYEVFGFEHLEGPAALLVGYHGRPVAYDLCMLTVVIHERLGYLPHGVVHDFLARAPGLRSIVDALGFVSSDGPLIAAAVARGEHVLVQPGGTREGFRSFRHRYEVDWGDRVGYLRLAIRHGLRIVPIAAAGVDDAFVGLNDGYSLGAKLGMPARIPLWIGIGLTGLWPLALPFPVRITQVIGEPIDLAAAGADISDHASLAVLHRRVTAKIQALLDQARGLRARAWSRTSIAPGEGVDAC
jgi:hypothetical protein